MIDKVENGPIHININTRLHKKTNVDDRDHLATRTRDPNPR